MLDILLLARSSDKGNCHQLQMNGLRRLMIQALGKRLPLLFLAIASTVPSHSQTTTCATCHSKIVETYARTGMGRSFSKPIAIEPARFYHKLSDTWYSMEQRGGQTYQRRWRIGIDGKEAEVQETRIDYVMGSGNHVRTYLHRTDSGALIELPLAWYPEGGGTWAMNPGHDRGNALPPRRVAYECMFCHNAYPKIPAGHSEYGSEPLYAGQLPEGIDCQRCHGSGVEHMRVAQKPGAKVDEIRKAIVNPARLSRERQMETCMQCHLETTSAQLPHSIVKFGRGPFSFRVGEPLENFMLTFDRAPAGKPEDNFEIVHSAYRLRKSKCFLESRMTCQTCHNPHDIPRGAEATAHYNEVCSQCHLALPAGHMPSQNCVNCHMPRRRTEDVVQTVMTDHYIQRRPPPGDLTAMISERTMYDRKPYQGEVVPYYPSLQPSLQPSLRPSLRPSLQPIKGIDALYLAVAQVTQRSNLSQGLPRLAAAVEQQKPARPEFYIELGEAWLAAHNPRKAALALDAALQRAPGSFTALLGLAEALTESGDSARALQALQRAVKAAPDEPLVWYQLGLATGDTKALERSIELDPWQADAYNLLGSLRAEAGDFARAQAAWRLALQVEPDMPDAQGNLGHLLASRGDLRQAEYYLARAVQGKPGDAEIRENYAATLAGLNKFAEAETQAEAAVKANPKSAEAHNFLGSLLARRGQGELALGEFLQAVKLRSDFGLGHLNAAQILTAKGDLAGARDHLQQAARDSDPAIRERALRLLR